MSYRAFYKDGFCISTEKARLDIKAIHHFLSTQAYWSLNIPYSRVEEAAMHSLNFGLYFKEKQIGYARVISDFSCIAYVGDLYVLPEFRGKGLSKWLMKTIMTYPELQGLRRWILSTADAHGLYKQFGWKPVAFPDRWMEVHNGEVYTRLS
ncbi:MAG TPA: GNAT family N-acetyltransferase [Puia sp.]|jgi:GNAT superfamily N-acetyltransferase|nr:GNAT family N-acetyltransferase [Puia sp.]